MIRPVVGYDGYLWSAWCMSRQLSLAIVMRYIFPFTGPYTHTSLTSGPTWAPITLDLWYWSSFARCRIGLTRTNGPRLGTLVSADPERNIHGLIKHRRANEISSRPYGACYPAVRKSTLVHVAQKLRTCSHITMFQVFRLLLQFTPQHVILLVPPSSVIIQVHRDG